MDSCSCRWLPGDQRKLKDGPLRSFDRVMLEASLAHSHQVLFDIYGAINVQITRHLLGN